MNCFGFVVFLSKNAVFFTCVCSVDYSLNTLIYVSICRFKITKMELQIISLTMQRPLTIVHHRC